MILVGEQRHRRSIRTGESHGRAPRPAHHPLRRRIPEIVDNIDNQRQAQHCHEQPPIPAMRPKYARYIKYGTRHDKRTFMPGFNDGVTAEAAYQKVAANSK